ncbi:TolC family protein [Sphingobium sp.]|uniref:TolC family protein n=1 Tax=Sphingobium sp. TaxID=1912891 RepID=UPI002608A00D|nr:TolC family protein [Sphingobium sp.]
MAGLYGRKATGCWRALTSGAAGVALLAGGVTPVSAQPASVLAPPNMRPFSAPTTDDPLLRNADAASDPALFHDEVAAAVQTNVVIDEARAGEREAQAARVEARSALFPTIDLSIDANRSLARNFSNDVGNIIERSRPEGRTDATASMRQRLLDFGATSTRISAATARLEAARLTTRTQGEDVALRTIAAWYAIYAQRLMEEAAIEYGARQEKLREQLERRITQGYSARGDLPRVDSAIATTQLRLARFRRDLNTAEAQYRTLTGHDAPAQIGRAPLPRNLPTDAAELETLLLQSPTVRKAEAEARAARQDARAARAERLPTIAAGVDAGRYGVFESPGDYDVRGRILVRAQLGAGFNARADQATARADAADAYATRVRQEALRDAQTALTDLKALDAQVSAAHAAYLASRDTRDVIAARFASSQGTLLDLQNVEDNYFYNAANYVQALSDRDAAHFILLAKTGQLLPHLAISIASSDRIARP